MLIRFLRSWENPWNRISNAETHAVYIQNNTRTLYARVYSTPDGHLRYLFSSFKFEVSQVPNGQKQALVNAIKYVCSLTLWHPCRHPSVSLRVQRYKKILIFANIRDKIYRILRNLQKNAQYKQGYLAKTNKKRSSKLRCIKLIVGDLTIRIRAFE